MTGTQNPSVPPLLLLLCMNETLIVINAKKVWEQCDVESERSYTVADVTDVNIYKYHNTN